ncbi:MAG: S41 family peptidase [Oscillospiraceae bacterium]
MDCLERNVGVLFDTYIISGITPLGNNCNERIYDQRKDIDLEKMDRNDATNSSYESFSSSEIDEEIYIAKIPSFQNEKLPDEFSQWIAQSKSTAKAYIIDVRGNNGGMTFFYLHIEWWE